MIFSLIDNYYRVIFQSKNNPYDLKSIFYIELFEEIRQRQSPLDDNFSFVKDTQFLYFKGLKSYPYMILTGINYSEFYMEVKQSIILQFIYILISLFSFILILLFFSYKKQRSFSCFQAVIKNYYFQFSVGSILDHIRGFSHPNESLLRIKKDKYPPSLPIESGLFIRDCLLLLEDNIDKYQVKIEINIKKNSLIEENHFSLQQILVGLLSFSIEHNKGKNISISSDSDEANLYIKIEDRTFFLSEGMRDQFSEKLREDNLFLLNFKNIKDTANTLGVKISIQEKSPKGNIILITIPHSSETGLNINQHNIISFEKIKTQKS